MAAHWEIYKDDAGKHRWRLRGDNHRIVASSGESFSSRFAVEIAILVAQQAATSSEVEDQT